MLVGARRSGDCALLNTSAPSQELTARFERLERERARFQAAQKLRREKWLEERRKKGKAGRKSTRAAVRPPTRRTGSNATSGARSALDLIRQRTVDRQRRDLEPTLSSDEEQSDDGDDEYLVSESV